MPTHDSGDAEHNAALAQRLLSTLELQTVVLTLDRHGALLLEQNRQPLPVPTVARDVYDVTGAGDMMIAALAAARANNIAWPEAVRFANAAAGLEVEVFGCVPIPLERIHAELLRHAASERGKLRTPAEARIEADAARAAGGKVVFTNGCFDVIHAGHIDLLQRAASLGDLLVIGLNDDESVKRLKGPTRPVNTQDDRAAVLSGVAGVGAVVLFGNPDDDTPRSLIEAVRPDILVKGADYTLDRVVGADLVQQWGGRVELVPLVQGRSTTGTIQKMRAGHEADA
jgi:D-beta-D-heptose 7-phosphate kinase/D-beta-D-heptose 1-phosphate adenosyltransferase